MKLKIEKRDSYYCSLDTFTINGIEADLDDFGEMDDTDRRNRPDYGCGCKQFIRHESGPSLKVLNKYNITKEEYSKICDELDKKLYIGRCVMCA